MFLRAACLPRSRELALPAEIVAIVIDLLTMALIGLLGVGTAPVTSPPLTPWRHDVGDGRMVADHVRYFARHARPCRYVTPYTRTRQRTGRRPGRLEHVP
jgi:hypothetical protein